MNYLASLIHKYTKAGRLDDMTELEKLANKISESQYIAGHFKYEAERKEKELFETRLMVIEREKEIERLKKELTKLKETI